MQSTLVTIQAKVEITDHRRIQCILLTQNPAEYDYCPQKLAEIVGLYRVKKMCDQRLLVTQRIVKFRFW